MKDFNDLDRRLASLKAARDQENRVPGSQPTAGRLPGLGLGFRIGVELVAGLAVGLGLGYLADGWLGTKPWLMIVFFFLGAAAGIMNVWRATKGMGDGVGFRRPGDRE